MIGWILFALHLLVDIAVIWYIREMLIRFKLLSQGFEDINLVLDEYADHVKKVSEMEAYFGDEIILNLLRHSVDTKEYLNEFRVLFSLDEEGTQDAESEE
tara:strand:- start:243 stop:542 length:300 start_codon:yes stop_codon:yes gene_type:complete